MAINTGTPIEPRGNKQERNLFKEVHDHYLLSKQDLDARIMRKNGFDDVDKLFTSHIDEANWPYSSMMFDPRPYTVIVEKSARLIGSKPKGRLVPREDGDSLGAMINNELLSFQWDDNSRLGTSMLEKWIMMDQTARKYGAAFATVKWKYQTKVVKGKKEVFFDGPDFDPINPRDVLANPSYSTIKHWFDYREWMTLDELQRVNDSARSEPVYKNLDVLRDAVREDMAKKGDRRDTEYNVQNKSTRGLSDYLGSDEVFKTIEIVNELREGRWIKFAPRYGVIIKDQKNPYDHGEIPVVMLKYYPLPDDLYGLGEFEPVAKLIRGINSLFSQYIDNITVDLYPPLMVNPVNVRMNTLEFTPEAKWLMNNPGQDVMRLETSTAATNNFSSAYQIMVGSLLNAWGEQSQGISQANPTEDANRVTATEIKDTAFTRNVRDNLNLIFLSEAIKKQTMFWCSMNKQFLFKGTKEQYKVIRVVGRDAAAFFERQGLSELHPTDEEVQMHAETGDELIGGPQYPVEMGTGDVVPKYVPDVMGTGGDLYMEPGDLTGTYDYIPDIESMKAPSDEDVEAKLMTVLGTITNPAVLQGLASENIKPKYKELLVKLYEATRVIKDADAYFEELPPPQPMMPGQVDANGQPISGGTAPPGAGTPGQGANGAPGMAPGPEAMAGGQNPQLMGGSPIV